MICRTWFGEEVGAVPPAAGLAPESQCARSEKRHTDHLPENGLVAVPADSGAGRIFRDEHLLQRMWLQICKLTCDLTQAKQIIRNIVGLLQSLRGEIIFPTKRNHPALSYVTMKLKLAKRQLAHACDERSFVSSAD